LNFKNSKLELLEHLEPQSLEKCDLSNKMI